MPLILNLSPKEAWQKYLSNFVKEDRFLESSKEISEEIKLSKRELLGLIIYSYQLDKNGEINVCWNNEDNEPNDGYLNVIPFIRCEHKFIPCFSKEDIIKAILETYDKYAKLGKSYGENRHLIIHTDLETRGLVKISKIHDEIKDFCVFDKVLLVHVNGKEGNNIYRFTFSEQYPGLGISHLRININTGELISSLPSLPTL